MNLSEFRQHVIDATRVYRKGDPVYVRQHGATVAVTIDAYAALPENAGRMLLVDCHYVTVGFTEAATALSHQEFHDTLLALPRGEFVEIDAEMWQGGPSYITIGGWIGEQEVALRLLALGVLHQVWDVVSPATFGMDGATADAMAGQGFVMASGLRQPDAADTSVPRSL